MKDKFKKGLTDRLNAVKFISMKAGELRRLLKQSGLTQRELARRVGVTETAVSQWLSKKRNMHPAFAKLVRQAVEKKGAAA